MILSSPRSQTPTLATANIQFQNSIMLITLKKSETITFISTSSSGKIFSFDSLYMCTEKLINWLFRPSHLSTLSVTQRTIIQVSPHWNKPRRTPENISWISGSDNTNISMQSMFLSWEWQITAHRQRTAVSSGAIWTEEESWAGTSTSGSTIQCSGQWSLVPWCNVHWYTFIVQHSTAPLSLPSFILSTL